MASTTLYSYVNPNIDPNLLCCICRTPFNEPVTTRTCSHTFCQGCILQAISISAQCPIDRSPLSLDFLVQADPIIRHLVDELAVECPNWEEGCRYTGQRQLIGAHLKNECGFVLVACEDRNCRKMTKRKDARKGCVHDLAADVDDQTTEVSSSMITCDFCSDAVTRLEHDQHVESCSEVIVPCKQSEHGCSWTGRRALLEAHMSSCPYESIRGFITFNSNRVCALSEENTVLRRKVDAMEGSIRSMQRELQTVKAALGPWYRTEGIMPSAAYRPSLPSEPSVPDTDASGGTGFGDSSIPNPPYHLHPSLSAVSPPVIPSTSSTSSSLADYFPPEEPSNTTRSFSTSARVHHNLSSFSAHHFPDHSAVNPPNASRSSPVAPLNISTSLEGSLTSLRESLVTLSAALESQGRRHELALTTEGLRVNEEVGSLKAVVHGLRMQVHAIMMDRNAQVTGRSPYSSNAGGGGLGTGLGSLHNDENWLEGTNPPGYNVPGGGAGGGGSAGWFPPVHPPISGRFSHHHQYYLTQAQTSITKL